MATRRPLYRLTVYAPKSEDPTETTVLTPVVGAVHANPFVLTSMQGVAGSKPYLGMPTGRQGSLNPETRKVTIGNLTIPAFDFRVTPGGINAERWVTAFLGDTLGRPRLKGCRFTLERALDGTVASLVSYFAGRVRNYSLVGPQQFTLDLTDFSADLNRRVFLAMPHPSVANYASSTALLPLGVPVPFGSATVPPLLPGTYNGVVQGYPRVSFDQSAGPSTAIVTKAMEGLQSHTVSRVVALTNVSTGVVGHFLWLPSAPVGRTEIGGAYRLFRHLRWTYVSIGLLPTGDARYTPFFPAGTPVLFRAFLDAPPTPDLPILVGDVHPVQHFADILDGKFSCVPGSEVARPLATRDTSFGGPWDLMIQDTSWGTIRNLVTAPSKANEYIEKVIGQSCNLGYRYDEAGRIVPIDLRRLNGVAATGATLTDDDLVADVEPTWQDSRDGAITAVEFTYYVDRVAGTEEILTSSEVFPDFSSTQIVSTSESLAVLNDVSTLKDVGEKIVKIDAPGIRVMAEERVRRRAVLAGIQATIDNYLRPFATGTVKATATYRQASNAAGLAPGALRLVNHSKLVNTATNARGGTRLMLCLSAADADDQITVEWLDCGANTTAAVPGITSVAATAANGVDVTVTGNAAGDDVEVWAVFTTTAVAVRPTSTDAAWVRAGVRSSGGTVSIDSVPPGVRCWTRARSLAKGGVLAQPSGYVFPSGTGYLDITSITAPSSVAVTTPSSALAHVTWTPGDATALTDILLVAGSAPASWPASALVTTVDAGSLSVDVATAVAGATYTIGVRHRDPTTGGTSAVASATFTAGSTGASLTPPSVLAGYSTGPIRFGVGAIGPAPQSLITYGLAAGATTLPSQIEFREAVETAPASGSYGSYTSVAVVDAVAGDWTTCALRAGSDGLRRRLSARTVVGNSASAWSSDVELLPSTALALPPLAGGPSLDVVGTAGTPYSIAYTAAGGTVQLSINGAPYSTAPASPVVVTRPAAGSPPLEYAFRITAAGQTVTNSVTVQPVDQDTVTPDLVVTPYAETDTYVQYVVTSVDPAALVTPINKVRFHGCTGENDSTATSYAADTDYTFASGALILANRALFGTTAQANVTFWATNPGGGTARIQRTVLNQVKTSFGPSLVVTPTPSAGSYSLAYSGTYTTLVLSIDGGAYGAPAASPITVTRGASSHTYSFKATKDGVDTVQTVTVPPADPPAVTGGGFSGLNYAANTIQYSWSGVNAPAGATYRITVSERTAGVGGRINITNLVTASGVSSPYTFTSGYDLDAAGTTNEDIYVQVEMISGSATVATSAEDSFNVNRF